MCGIAGFLHFDAQKIASENILKKMTDSIAHRGPDGEGAHLENNLALGHRRLAIIDLSTGDQPMGNNDNSLVLVFNGEIYNYIELRDELKYKYNFKTNSDTEVILAAYQEWGVNCVKKFNGMWAFVIWDKTNRRLFCSRDRIGEKPFFYTVRNNTFIFGSELKSLFAYGVEKEMNEEVLDVYLSFTYIPAPNTFFKNIFKLRPGHSLIIENGNISITQYWDLEFPSSDSFRVDEKQIFKDFEELFHDAVKIRMRSDVPFGAYLSGGLDSGSVVSSMTRCTEEPVNTFTIGFDQAEYDERDLARLVARKYNTKHLDEVVKTKHAEELMEKIAWCYDEPFGDASALPTYIVSGIASKYVKMVLTGDGGDEVLSGYTSHQGERFSQQFSNIPGLLSKFAIPKSISVLQALSTGSIKRKLARASKVVDSANMDFIDRVEAKRNGFSKAQRAELITDWREVRPAREFIEDDVKKVLGKDNFTKLSYWQLKVLSDGILCKVDRASMANGLETRIPFLDYRLVDLLASVSIKIKLKGYTRKFILRETIGKQLPEKLLTARKKGFTIPIRDWFQTDAGAKLEQRAMISAKSDIINKDIVNKIIDDHKNNKQDAGSALWTLAMLSYVTDKV